MIWKINSVSLWRSTYYFIGTWLNIFKNDWWFDDCFEHDQRLCHECVHDGLCDGKVANNCDIISLSEYETTLKTQLVKLNGLFIEVDEELKKQKAAFVEMFRKDPRISRDDDVLPGKLLRTRRIQKLDQYKSAKDSHLITKMYSFTKLSANCQD